MEKEGKIMSVENLNKFQKDLEEKEELRKKFDEKMKSERVTREKDYKAVVKIAQKLGYDIIEEDFVNSKSANFENMEKGELSEDELDKVAGGAAWMGPDAPDGHEVGCALFYYFRWSQYFYSDNYKCAACGSKKHGAIQGGNNCPYTKCIECGKITAVENNKVIVYP